MGRCRVDCPKIGCAAHTLLNWVRRDEVDAGTRPGVTSAEAQRIKDLEREVKELRRANEMRWPGMSISILWQAPSPVARGLNPAVRRRAGTRPLCHTRYPRESAAPCVGS